MTITIGIDPHKGSHTAVAIDSNEHVLDEIRVRSCSTQTVRLRDWAERFEERTWAVESAHGLGYLLAQQLVAAGENVIVAASSTSLTTICGVGPITAAMIIGQSGNIDRFLDASLRELQRDRPS